MPSLRPICVVTCLLTGCAAQTATQAQLDTLQKRLETEQRRTAAAEHKLDELENRVFLLTDQVESQKVAALHRQRQPQALPVVTLKPDGAGVEQAPAPAPASDVEMPGDDIAFEGAAASDDPGHTRTVLRIDGTKVASRRSDTRVRSSAPSSAPMATSADDNLGVAPAPSIRATAAAPTERVAPAAEPLALYKTAYDDLRAGRHEEAERGFREFVRRYPHHDYADNAQYWLGECFYDQRRFDKAAPEFRAVLTRWPTGNKAPDAMLKLGFSLLALGDADKGGKVLREVPASYPHTDAARLATERLAQLQSSEGTK